MYREKLVIIGPIGLRPVMDIVSRLQDMIEEITSNLVTIKCYQYESLT